MNTVTYTVTGMNFVHENIDTYEEAVKIHDAEERDDLTILRVTFSEVERHSGMSMLTSQERETMESNMTMVIHNNNYYHYESQLMTFGAICALQAVGYYTGVLQFMAMAGRPVIERPQEYPQGLYLIQHDRRGDDSRTVELEQGERYPHQRALEKLGFMMSVRPIDEKEIMDDEQ